MTAIFPVLGVLGGARTNSHLAWTFGGVTAFLLAWQGWFFLKSTLKPTEFGWDFVLVRSHYVQACVHFSVYAYWGWYWRKVYSEAPLILSQVAFLYVLEALLTWSLKQRWRLGFAPFPIIFSTNLFLWFRDDWYIYQFLLITVGVLGKRFIRWNRDGRLTHIFNPSAFALTVFSIVLIFTGTTEHTWARLIASTQDRAPHLFTEIFFAGLVVQFFFGVTLLTFSATAALVLINFIYTQVTGVYLFHDTNLPTAVFLGAHLLMTDPATTPKNSLGKIIFGGLYGVCVILSAILLTAFQAPAFYDKLLVVPVLNLMVKGLDRLGNWSPATALTRLEGKVGASRMNLAYMGGWIALFVGLVAMRYVEAPHPGAKLAFWKKAAEENRLHAADRLRRLLEVFDLHTLTDGERLTLIETNNLTREQALGQLYNEVALIHYEGKLVKADPAKAARYFEEACQYGDTDGCANFAIEYFHATMTGAEAAIDRALTALEQPATTSTNGKACYLVGFAYDSARGRLVDKVKARTFYEKGAALGEPATWGRLAVMQYGGEGGPPDHDAAARWFQKAADMNDGASCFYLAQMYYKGDGVVIDKQKAASLLEKACSLGVTQACDMLKAPGKQK